MKTLYNNTPGGCCGNDDCGQMSAWYVLSAMGFYPVSPASGVYVLGSPVVDKATIHLDPKYQKGGKFTIVAEDNSPTNVYIQSATLNGKPLDAIVDQPRRVGCRRQLVLKMGPKPNPAWGQRPEDRPPATSFVRVDRREVDNGSLFLAAVADECCGYCDRIDANRISRFTVMSVSDCDHATE